MFSFGVVLYEMATGKEAFAGNTSAVVFEAILNRAASSPLRLNPKLPAELEPILNKALEKNARSRYDSAARLKARPATAQERQRFRPDSGGGRAGGRAIGGGALL